MPVRIVYRPVGEGFVVDTPAGPILFLDPALTVSEQGALADELLDADECADVRHLLTA